MTRRVLSQHEAYIAKKSDSLASTVGATDLAVTSVCWSSTERVRAKEHDGAPAEIGDKNIRIGWMASYSLATAEGYVLEYLFS